MFDLGLQGCYVYLYYNCLLTNVFLNALFYFRHNFDEQFLTPCITTITSLNTQHYV